MSYENSRIEIALSILNISDGYLKWKTSKGNGGRIP